MGAVNRHESQIVCQAHLCKVQGRTEAWSRANLVWKSTAQAASRVSVAESMADKVVAGFRLSVMSKSFWYGRIEGRSNGTYCWR